MSFIDLLKEKFKKVHTKSAQWSETFNENEKDERSKKKKRITFLDFLNETLLYWGNELNLTDEEFSDIRKFYKEIKDIYVTDVVSIWRSYTRNDRGELDKQKSEKSVGSLKQYISTKKLKIRNMIPNITPYFTDIGFVVFVAFVITAVYLVVSKLNQAIKEQTKTLSDVLVLVINVGKENIIQLLQKDPQVTINNYEELYSATQALWIGSINVFSQEFQPWFDENYKVPENEKSEYDVYLVKISLKNDNSGFKSDAGQLERLDAFRKLPENSQEVLVSPRLSSKAYRNKHLYNR
ncbi:MAG: hypothetical protein KME57_06750 [Scytonema hyalinum WJT4-NPBG1]|jgi:hypothetical protein|nr:hypothetical protein [Scytonema hyalinum WJT4-NPBG1]